MGLLLAIGASSLTAPPNDVLPFEDRALDAVTAPELQQVENDAAFVAYLERAETIRNHRGKHWTASRQRPIRLATP